MAQLASIMEASAPGCTGETIVVVEAGLSTTRIVRLKVLAPSLLLEDFQICDAPLLAENGSTKILQANVRRVVEQLGHGCKKISLMVNDECGFNLVQRVPIGTETAIRAHLRQQLFQTNKIDISKYYWTVTPLHPAAGVEQNLSDVVANKLNALVCAARKEQMDALQAAFKKQGCAIEHTFFAIPSLLRSFTVFAGNAFDNETVALLHVQSAKAWLAIVRQGVLVDLHEFPLESPFTVQRQGELRQQIKATLLAAETKLRLKVRCTFVSGDNAAADKFTATLKEHGFYVRNWSVARKFSLGLDASKREQLQNTGEQLNAILGSALLCEASEKLARSARAEEDNSVEVSEVLQRFAGPIAAVTCLLLAAFLFLWHWNWYSAEQVRLVRAKLKSLSVVTAKSDPAIPINRRINELETFARSRHTWPPVLAEIRNLSISGVQLLQVRATDTLTIAEANPFDPESRAVGRTRKLLGSLILEAQNQGGLTSLENFINQVKLNPMVRPLLSKKKPVRLLNNIRASEENTAQETTLFTVEYALDERSF